MLLQLKTSDFTWDMSWNFTKNNNKLVELQDDLQNYILTNAPFRVQLAAQVAILMG